MTKERACANSPALSRRTLLAALPAAGATFALPATAEPSLDFELGRRSAIMQMIELLESTRATAQKTDPVLPHFAAWKAARDEWERLSELPGNEDFDHPDSIEAQDREHAAFVAILDSVPASVAGVAAVAEVLATVEQVDRFYDWPEPDQHTARLIGNIITYCRSFDGDTRAST